MGCTCSSNFQSGICQWCIDQYKKVYKKKPIGIAICPVDHKACSYYGSKICTKDETCIGLGKEDK